MTAPTQKLPQGRMPYVHLLIVYLVWGSTFVAMRAVVMENSGFKPFSVGASRLIVASSILFAWAILRKKSLRLKRSDLFVTAVSGLLIWVCGNGFVMWAEQWVDAGYATLIFSTLPIWTTLMDCVLTRKWPSPVLVGAFITAFAGMGLLGGQSLLHGQKQILVPTLVILCSTFLWSISTHLQKRKPVSCSMFVASAYQQLFGSLGCVAMHFITQEPWPSPTPKAWTAWIYLVIFGSVLAYSSYVTVVQLFPSAIATTFAYVCPILTVIFAKLILNEPITLNKIAGMIIILGSVYCIFLDQKKR